MGIQTALLINENEDLIRVGATEYPLSVKLPDTFPKWNHALAVNYYPFLPVQQTFKSDMALIATDYLQFTDALSLHSSKVMLLTNQFRKRCKRMSRTPVRVHNRRLFQ